MYYSIVWYAEKTWGYCIIDEDYLKEEHRALIERAKKENNKGQVRVFEGNNFKALKEKTERAFSQLCEEMESGEYKES